MNANSRRIVESPLYLGEDEGEVYTLTVPASWATNPTGPVVTIYDDTNTDVTATTTQGNTTVSSQVITLARITGRLYRVTQSLTAGGIVADDRYTMTIEFTTSTGVKSCYCEIIGQK